jgi:flagellar hook-associated protein 1 FlgK
MLNMGARSLAAQQTGVEVTGHNIANANNAAYSRQRVKMATSLDVPTSIGQEGTGVDATEIQRVRDTLLDAQIQVETSVTGSLNTQQSALQQAEAALGQSLDSTSKSNAASGTDATGSEHGLGDALSSFFSELQNLANDPSSLTQRQSLMMQASSLATRFNQVDSQLGAVQDGLDQKLDSDVTQANQLLKDIADLNQQISQATLSSRNPNDLMDTRQSKIEELSGLIKVDVAQGDNNSVTISTGGVALVSGSEVSDTIETNQDSGQFLQIRAKTSQTALSPAGGSIEGAIAVRDGAIQNARTGVNALATSLIQSINSIHSTGYSLNNSTGADFFKGTSAADIAVNSDLLNNPSLVQASGASGATSDNQTVLAMAQVANTAISDLNDQTLSQHYSAVTTALGKAASLVNSQIDDQKIVTNMLTQQRNATSGVSMDEEMTSLLTYQKAYQASAKIVSTVDQMLSTVIDMKQ